MNTGVTKSKRIWCDDGGLYIVKFNTTQFPRVATNEILAARLGELVGVPVIKGVPVLVEQDLIDNEPGMCQDNGEKLPPGVHFAAPWVEPSWADPTREMLETTENREEIPWIFVFDLWILNFDRHNNVGNLIVGGADRRRRVIMIDHGHSFAGPSWVPAQVRGWTINDEMHFGQVYQRLAPLVRGSAPFEAPLLKIEGLERKDLEEVVNGLPRELGLDDNEATSLIDFLDRRRMLVRGILIRQTANFAHWA